MSVDTTCPICVKAVASGNPDAVEFNGKMYHGICWTARCRVVGTEITVNHRPEEVRHA